MTSGREASAQAGPDPVGPSAHRARFQPIVDLRTGRPIGWDVGLADREDDDGGLGVLASLTEAGRPPGDGFVFVKVSAALLGDPRLIEHAERLESRIVVDIRGAEMDRLSELSSELDALATAGVHLSIENTSAVSLAMIARVRPSFVKLDAPLVRDIAHEPANRSVVRAYVAFAEHEEIHLIAEGVSRAEQLDELRSLGVVLARGPLFGQPSSDWAAPVARRRRPPVVLDPAREAGEAMADAADATEVAQLLVGELRRLGDRSAVYYERDGLLRCVAYEGHAELLDGIPVGSGVVGRAFRSGGVVRAEEDEAALPCIAHPIDAGDRAVGVAMVARTDAFPADAEAELRTLVGAAGQRLTELGAILRDSSTRRLSRANLELSVITDVHEVEIAATRLATVVGGMSSSAFALPGSGGFEIRALQGPLTAELRAFNARTMQALLDEIGPASSLCVTSHEHDGFASTLFEAGVSSFTALPVRSVERGAGLLLLADHAPVRLELDRREALELLAREIGRTFDMVMLVDDLRTRATVDTLTGLGNLSSFQEALNTLGTRRRGSWALVMADVDGLKAVNDTHGHLTGDLALRRLAGALHDVLRAEDRMFRIGGDEFAALLQDVDAEGAEEIGRRMCEAATVVMSDFGAGLSVGIAIPEPGEAPADFIDRADKMLYQVKRQDRGTVRVAPPTGRNGS